MKELNKQYEIVVEHGHNHTPNIVVTAERGEVKVVLNGSLLFNTLANKDTILVALNDKLSELLQRHLETEAKRETAIREGC